MNSNLKIGLAFVAGGVLMNAGVAFSNAPSTQDMLADAMSMAINKANEAAEQREDARLEKMPNIMDCQKMTWMQSCSELNKQAKKNPNNQQDMCLAPANIFLRRALSTFAGTQRHLHTRPRRRPALV